MEGNGSVTIRSIQVGYNASRQLIASVTKARFDDATDTGPPLNINHTAIGGTPAAQEGFSYDAIGNWKNYRKDLGGVPAIEQDRVSNLNNQITQIYPNDPTPQYPGYDANGNTTEVPTGEALDGPTNQLVWDAWNRLQKVLDAADNVIVEYQYDGQFRRTVSQVEGVTRHFYYNDAWRSVEERLDSSPDPVVQYVWQPGNRWELIFRDRDTTGDGTLDERRYCLKDGLDVVALCDVTGTVTERFAYRAFGRVTFLDAAFAAQPSSASGWNLLFHAEFVDAETGWMDYGFRYYSIELGRWLSRDPIGEAGGLNLHVYAGNCPVNFVDLFGLNPITSIGAGAKSYFRGIGRGVRQAGRHSGLLGKGEANKAKTERQLLGRAIGEALRNPGFVAKALGAAWDRASGMDVVNALSYVGGRLGAGVGTAYAAQVAGGIVGAEIGAATGSLPGALGGAKVGTTAGKALGIGLGLTAFVGDVLTNVENGLNKIRDQSDLSEEAIRDELSLTNEELLESIEEGLFGEGFKDPNCK